MSLAVQTNKVIQCATRSRVALAGDCMRLGCSGYGVSHSPQRHSWSSVRFRQRKTSYNRLEQAERRRAQARASIAEPSFHPSTTSKLQQQLGATPAAMDGFNTCWTIQLPARSKSEKGRVLDSRGELAEGRCLYVSGGVFMSYSGWNELENSSLSISPAIQVE